MWERPFAAMQQHADAAGKIDWTGLWERLRGGSQRVALLLTDSFTGLLWHLSAPARGQGEGSASPWSHLFKRARRPGLDWNRIHGVTSDGTQGLNAFLRHTTALGAVPALRLAYLTHLDGRIHPRGRPGCSGTRQ